jgi:hypothetical protein
MTAITKPIPRKTASLYHGRPLVVTEHPRHLEVRELRRRDVVSVDYITLYEFGMKLRYRRNHAEQEAQKRKRGRQ